MSTATRSRLTWTKRLATAVIAWLAAACASPYSLPPRAVTTVGKAPALVCAAGQVQVCRDHGTALQCACRD